MDSTGLSKLSYDEILGLAKDLNTSASNMKNTLDEVKMLFAKIGTDEVWSGTAATDTKAEFDKLSEKFEGFSDAVKKCSTYLNTVVENYQSVDTMITRES